MSVIRVTPDTLHAQGQDLAQLAQQTQDVLQQVDVKIASINDSWDGLAQDGYWQMYQDMKQTLTRMPELLLVLSQKTKQAADVFGQVDKSLQSSFTV